MKPKPNSLVSETSPYLLQHAYNPVEWHPWTQKTLKKAKDQNKLIIISIGYAACHWCHVMEHECFEDNEVAVVMNQSYINIKVDREERPDIDQVYMSALQIMTGRGGWPSNIVALPDGRPVWGGTYFPKENWIQALNQIASLYRNQPEKLEEYGAKLKAGMLQLNIDLDTKSNNQLHTIIQQSIHKWNAYMDHSNGGLQRIPKFMMPHNYKFLMRYAFQYKNNALLDYVLHTLNKISYGGIFDHIAGGFSRYSTDEKWHIPHFEKMLYDNAQLVSLYADAYKLTQNLWYKDVCYQTLQFISDELTSPQGLFYSAIDADSRDSRDNLVEGEFYTWTKTDLRKLLKYDFALFKEYYNINPYGKWEEDKYVLIKSVSDDEFCTNHSITATKLSELKSKWKTILLRERKKRPKPLLDDKCLTCWNGLMISAYIDAYTAFKEERFLKTGLKAANYIVEHLIEEDSSLFRNYKNGQPSINAYLEDYATLIESFIKLHNTTLNLRWLRIAKQLTDYTVSHFYDNSLGLFYFTSDKDPELIIRTIEIEDNVISSSNSIMFQNLYTLNKFYEDEKYATIYAKMLKKITQKTIEYPMGYANWLYTLLNENNELYEIVVVGKEADHKLRTLNLSYIPNALITGSLKESELPIFKDKYKEAETLMYLCDKSSCFMVTKNIENIIVYFDQKLK